MNDSFSQFYDALAADYDAMTGFDQRFAAEQGFFASMVEKYKIKTALDAGCGAGAHALLLARLGVAVTAVDASEEMLRAAAHHADAMRLPVTLRRIDLFRDTDSILERFDAAFCMGNTIAHAGSVDEAQKAIGGLLALLRPGGILVVQLLNFERILKDCPRIINRKTVGDATYVRYYSYDKDTIVFKILTMRRTGARVVRTLITTRLCPLRRKDLAEAFVSSGLTPLMYGGIDFSPFNAAHSKDILVICQLSSISF
jgi:SAM-dependent methyltransferase